METEACLSQAEMTHLIHVTLTDAISELNGQIEAIRPMKPEAMPEESLLQLIDQTRKLVVFLKYSSEYMRKTFTQPKAREEMLRIKLHLLSVLRALSDQVRLKDNVAIHDLITEELRDNLTMWKINVIPLLRPPRAVPQAFGSIHP